MPIPLKISQNYKKWYRIEERKNIMKWALVVYFMTVTNNSLSPNKIIKSIKTVENFTIFKNTEVTKMAASEPIIIFCFHLRLVL